MNSKSPTTRTSPEAGSSLESARHGRWTTLVLTFATIGAGCSSAASTDAGPADTSDVVAVDGVDAVDSPADVAVDIATDAALDAIDAAPDVNDATADQIETSTGDVASDAPDACTRSTTDPAAIGTTCTVMTDCPAGYVCQPFSGVVLTQSCEILCASDCDCPSSTHCVSRTDKSHTWMQCSF